jgi:hypothetical protein
LKLQIVAIIADWRFSAHNDFLCRVWQHCHLPKILSATKIRDTIKAAPSTTSAATSLFLPQ